MRKILVALALVPSALFAQGGDQQPPQQTVVLNNVNLDEITRAVQKKIGKKIMYTEDTGLRSKKIHFLSSEPIKTNDELWAVYQAILQMNGFTIVKVTSAEGDLWKVVTLDKSRVAGGMTPAGKEITHSYVTQLFRLKYIKASQFYAKMVPFLSNPQNVASIDEVNALLVSDYDYIVEKISKLIEFADVKPADVLIKVISLKNSQAQQIEQNLNDLMQVLLAQTTGGAVTPGPMPTGRGGTEQERIKIVSDMRTNSLIVLATEERYKQVEDIVRILDTEPTYEAMTPHVVPLKYMSSAEAAKLLQSLLSSQFQSQSSSTAGTGGAPTVISTGGGSKSSLGMRPPTISNDERTNSLIVIADNAVWRLIESILAKLDRKRPQVLLKAYVVEVSADEDFNWETKLAYLQNVKIGDTTVTAALQSWNGVPVPPVVSVPNSATSALSGLTQSTGASLFYLTRDARGLDAAATIFKGKVDLSVKNSPEVVTHDNTKAKIQITDEVPFSETFVPGTATGFVQQTFKTATAKTTLEISPHINDYNRLMVDVKVNVENFSGKPPQPNAPPPKITREVNSVVEIISGQTIVIGGISIVEDRKTTGQIPLLGDIPLLGYLFKTYSTKNIKKTQYVFITPYILYEENQGDWADATSERIGELEKLRGKPLDLPGRLTRVNEKSSMRYWRFFGKPEE